VLSHDSCFFHFVFFALHFSKEQTDTSQLRLDPLPYTEEYFAAYNGVVILASNPYINYARTLGLNSVATGGYSPTGEASADHTSSSDPVSFVGPYCP
jgi:hypothetical protein